MPDSEQKNAPTAEPPPRRSPCPVACGLDIFGDRWTLLIVRDLLLGRTRYKDFAASPERIPTNLLANRLERLLQRGIVRQVPVSKGAKHLAYELTPKGRALRHVVLAMRDWGLEWEPGTDDSLGRATSPERAPAVSHPVGGSAG